MTDHDLRLRQQRRKLRRVALIVEDRAFQRRLDFGENPRRDAGGEMAEKQGSHEFPSPTHDESAIVALPLAVAQVLLAKRWRKNMANVYIEPRPKGRPEGSAIDDYVVEDHADHVLHTCKTQAEAIRWAQGQGHHPLVARVRHLNDKKIPDHWRSAA